jgi:hypothetical protein
MLAINGVPLKKILFCMDASDLAFNQDKLPAPMEKLAAFGSGESGAPLTWIGREGPDIYIIIRGSTEASDFLIGFQAAHTPFLQGEIHEGAYRASRYILEQSRRYIEECKGEIILTGHSLGGSCAAVVAAILRLEEKRSNVSAITAASFPVFDSRLKKATEPFITGFIYGNDPVPFMTERNVQRIMLEFGGSAPGIPEEQVAQTAQANIVKWLKGVLESRGFQDQELVPTLNAAAPAIVSAILSRIPGPDLLSAGVSFRVTLNEKDSVDVEPFIDGKELGARELLMTVIDHNQQQLIGCLRKYMLS